MPIRKQKIDRYVKIKESCGFGSILRAKRHALGKSQSDLGDAIGVTFQQVQKYERGVNRINLPIARKIAEALGFAPAEFFGEAPEGAAGSRRHLEASGVIMTFSDEQLTAFKHFCKAIGKE